MEKFGSRNRERLDMHLMVGSFRTNCYCLVSGIMLALCRFRAESSFRSHLKMLNDIHDHYLCDYPLMRRKCRAILTG